MEREIEAVMQLYSPFHSNRVPEYVKDILTFDLKAKSVKYLWTGKH